MGFIAGWRDDLETRIWYTTEPMKELKEIITQKWETIDYEKALLALLRSLAL